MSSVKTILKLGHPALRQRCAEAVDFNVARQLAADLWATLDALAELYDFRRGTGLAAPQVGDCCRLFVAEYGGIRRTFVNPQILWASPDIEIVREGCLSFFDFRGMVPRHREVHVAAFGVDECRFEVRAAGEDASLLQHELDHLDGILYFDRLPSKEADLFRIEGMPMIP